MKKPQIKALDTLWATKIKTIAGWECEHCHKTSRLNAHHIISRSNHATRWEIPNGICLCVGCHTFSSYFSAHKTPMEFIDWIRDTRGEKWEENLRAIARQKLAKDFDEIKAELS